MKSPYFKYYTPAFEDLKPFPIYALWCESVKGYGDVGADKLHDEGFPVPVTPTYETWRNLVISKQKCGRCFATVRGAADLEHHNATNHTGADIYVPA